MDNLWSFEDNRRGEGERAAREGAAAMQETFSAFQLKQMASDANSDAERRDILSVTEFVKDTGHRHDIAQNIIDGAESDQLLNDVLDWITPETAAYPERLLTSIIRSPYAKEETQLKALEYTTEENIPNPKTRQHILLETVNHTKNPAILDAIKNIKQENMSAENWQYVSYKALRDRDEITYRV